MVGEGGNVCVGNTKIPDNFKFDEGLPRLT